MMKIREGRLRFAAILFVFAAGLVLASLGILGTLSAQAAEGEQVKLADIVVQFDDHDVIIRPISFTGEISGLRALELSGLEIITAENSFGISVCAIEGIGFPSDNCFGGGSTFWGNSYWSGGAWNGYMVGARDTVISQTGAVEGWRWGVWGDTPPPPSEVQAAQRGLIWLHAQQVITDGSYGGQAGASIDVMLAIGANHLEADGLRGAPDAPSLMDFVTFAGAKYGLTGVSEAGKLATGVAAADGCWPPGAPVPSQYYSPTLGSMSDQAGFLSWAILGTIAISEPVPADSVSYLRGLAQPDGGWEWSPGWSVGVDTNATALAIQALASANVPISATEIVSGLAYLKSVQNADGGFPYAPKYGKESDTNSTAWVVQALMAASEDPRSAAWTQKGKTPMDYLLSRQFADGSFEWKKGQGSNQAATRQAVAALLGSPYPIRVQPAQACSVESTLLPLIEAYKAGPK